MSTDVVGRWALSAARRRAYIVLALKRVRPGSGSHHRFLTTHTLGHAIVDLRQIIRRPPFVLAGAVATRLDMPERATADVDGCG